MFRRILVPLDGSTRAELALPVAAHLARVAGGVMILARVISPPLVVWRSSARRSGGYADTRARHRRALRRGGVAPT